MNKIENRIIKLLGIGLTNPKKLIAEISAILELSKSDISVEVMRFLEDKRIWFDIDWNLRINK